MMITPPRRMEREMKTKTVGDAPFLLLSAHSKQATPALTRLVPPGASLSLPLLCAARTSTLSLSLSLCSPLAPPNSTAVPPFRMGLVHNRGLSSAWIILELKSLPHPLLRTNNSLSLCFSLLQNAS